MKRKHLLILAAAVMSLMATSCVEHEEIAFAGTVMDVLSCNGSFFDENPGYIVKLDYPDSIGGTLTNESGTSSNLIVLYEPTCRIMVRDHIHGTFYVDDKYSRVNCSLHWDNIDLPEGVFMKVVVD